MPDWQNVGFSLLFIGLAWFVGLALVGAVTGDSAAFDGAFGAAVIASIGFVLGVSAGEVDA